MKKSLSIGIAASALYLAGCGVECPEGQLLDEASGTCVNNNNTNCGPGTVDDGSGNCVVDTNCNTNPGLCDADETCNAVTGQCDPNQAGVFLCTPPGGGLPVEAQEADTFLPGATQLDATLNNQLSNTGDGGDAVFHVSLTEKSDLSIRTLFTGTAPDTIITVRQGNNCDTATEIANVDNINSANGQAAVVSLRSLSPGDYFIFVDSKLASPLANVQIELNRTQIVAQGGSCFAGLSTQRCDDGTACLNAVISANPEAFNSCEPFAIPNTRLFVTDDTGFISELDPANGAVRAQVATPVPTTGTEHLALAYDDVGRRLFWHNSDNLATDPVINSIASTEVIVLNADDFSRVTQWGIPAGFQIEGLGFNTLTGELASINANDDNVKVLDPTNGAVTNNYFANNADTTEFGGLAVDVLSFQPGAHGYQTRSVNNQLHEFVLGVGQFIRTIGAPPQVGLQCGLGSHGDFAFIGYAGVEGIIRVVTTVPDVFPGLPEGSFVTEYRTPGNNPCGVGAGGL
jgi:hypothetical protein